MLIKMNKEGKEVSYDDINPLTYSIDYLTTLDEMRKEYNEIQGRIEERKLKKESEAKIQAEKEAEEKRLSEIRSEAEKLYKERLEAEKKPE